ncbi:hypothetical protein AC628_00960 [Bradyrhizobium sp. NAS96.2]|nr:hypothetical protein AC628_00960 [Bradyrhizobium sp. NAS96.2]
MISILSKGDEIVEGLRELMVLAPFKPSRAETTLALLDEFANASPFRLAELLDGVLGTLQDFLALADRVLTQDKGLGEAQRDLWLVVCYLLFPNRYEALLELTAASRPAIIFRVRDHSGYGTFNDRPRNALSLPQLEFLARLTGALFPEVGVPAGVMRGDTTAFDGTECFRQLISTISTVPSEAATAIRSRQQDSSRSPFAKFFAQRATSCSIAHGYECRP